MTYGPADLYVVVYPKHSVPVSVTATLRDVDTAGIITLLDLAIVRTNEDGSSQLMELDEVADEIGMLGVMPRATGLIGMHDIEELAEDLTPGTSCLIVVMENTWARKITRAVKDDNARVIAIERFTAEGVNQVAARLSQLSPLKEDQRWHSDEWDVPA